MRIVSQVYESHGARVQRYEEWQKYFKTTEFL